MKKIAYLLSVYLFCLLPKLQAQDIDFPLSLSEIEKYESRIRIQRLPAVTITHADAYKIRTRQPVYSPRTKEIVLDIINMDGPTAELEYHNLKQMVNGKWLGFPFIDNLVFAIGGRDLSKGDTLPEHIRMSEFKYPLKPNRYQANFYVFANIHTYCNLTGKSIVSIKETEMDGAFAFKVLPSNNDSIRILFENHTNLEVQPVFFPSISTDERYMVHPFGPFRLGRRSELYEKPCPFERWRSDTVYHSCLMGCQPDNRQKRQETIPSRQVTFRKIPNRTATRNLYGYGI